MKPSWEDPVEKREKFSISMRKKKRDAMVKNKRQKILTLIEEQKKLAAKNDISDEEMALMNSIKSKIGLIDDDPFT